MGHQARAVKAALNLTDQAIIDFDLYMLGAGKQERAVRMAGHEGALGHPCSLRLNLPPPGAMFFVGSHSR